MQDSLKMAISDGKETFFIQIKNIIYCKSYGGYSVINILGEKPIYLSKSLKSVCKSLPADLFFRIHNQYVVNINFVSKFTETKDSSVILLDGTLLPVSRRKKADFMSNFRKF
ncbi:MAG: LytTR family DNA-binding domain-containing protein [Saprospiraceae bacterium]